MAQAGQPSIGALEDLIGRVAQGDEGADMPLVYTPCKVLHILPIYTYRHALIEPRSPHAFCAQGLYRRTCSCRDHSRHGDPEAANVLLRLLNPADFVIKVADFGMSQAANSTYVTGTGGTYGWMAPEMYPAQDRRDFHARRGAEAAQALELLLEKAAVQGKVTGAADVFSLGVTLWEIYHGGDNPYPGKRPMDVEGAYLGGDPDIRLAIDTSRIPPCVGDLIEACWAEDFTQRPPIAELAAARAALEGGEGMAAVLKECRAKAWSGKAWLE
ncbi:MAG: kinase-like domain-containing protein [Monoraphidium minutum]|nr:MAG: kinase-like domain-containing protein [Monoraphidium minutum]